MAEVCYFYDKGYSCALIEKSTYKEVLYASGDCIAGLSDGKIFVVNEKKPLLMNGKKATLMNENFEKIKEISLSRFISIVEIMNENVLVAVKESTFITLIDFNNGKSIFKSDSGIKIIGLIKLTDDKFAYCSESFIHIRDITGRLIHNLNKVKDKMYLESIRKLSGSLLIASFRCNNGFQIWNTESGVLIKEIFEYYAIVGTCSFGFLARPLKNKNFLHAFDMDGSFIGVVSTETVSNSKITKVIQMEDDMYAFLFKKTYKLIKCW